MARGRDAIVCVNDVLAIGALKYLRDTGRRVPDDVAVTGWDTSRTRPTPHRR